MNRITFCLLTAFFAFESHNAISRTNSRFPSHIHFASIEIRTSLHGNQWSRLVQRPYLLFPQTGKVVDSTLVDTNGVIRFRFVPDPNSWYRIDVADAPVVYGCFAMGDSIVVQKIRDSLTLKILYDRIGAYTKENQYYLYYGEKADIIDFIKDTSCSEIPLFLDTIRARSKRISEEAERIKMDFPEHAYFVRDLNRWSRIFETSALSVIVRSMEKTGNANCNSFENGWLDTVSINFQNDFLDPHDLFVIVSFVMEARFAKVKRMDSTALNHYGLETLFKIASQFTGLDRYFAYARLPELAYDAPPDDILPYLERMLDTIRFEHGSPVVSKELERRELILLRRKAGSDASDFMLPDSNYKIQSLSDFRGKAVLLHFWGTWCVPCLKQLSLVSAFERNYISDSNLVCINIALEKHNYDGWKRFLKEHHLPGVELYSEGLWDSDAAKQYSIDIVPSNVIIDRQGKIVSSHIGSGAKEFDIQKDIEIAERQ